MADKKTKTVSKKVSDAAHVCIECRWCDLCIDFDSGSCYVCQRTGRPQGPGAVIHKPACADFELPPASPHWGP